MSDDSQILISRLLAQQTLRRDDRLVKRVLSDELFRAEVDQRLLACGMRLLDNVYADHVTLALTREIEPKVFGAKDVWQNNNFGLARDGVALLVVLWAQIILPKRERQETHQHADDDQNDMFGVDKPLPRAEDSSIGIPYKALLADFGDKLGKKTRMDMNLGILSKLGFIERRLDVIFEGPLLDLVMDTDLLKERIVNGALADVFKRKPTQIVHIPRAALAQAQAQVAAEVVAEAVEAVEPEAVVETVAEVVAEAVIEAVEAPAAAVVIAAVDAVAPIVEPVAEAVAATVVATVVAPAVTEPVAEPIAEPAAEPVAEVPVTAEPVVSESVAEEPVATDVAEVAEVPAVDVAVVEPVAAEAAAIEAAPVEAAPVDPAPVEPVVADPVPAQAKPAAKAKKPAAQDADEPLSNNDGWPFEKFKRD